MVGQEKIQKLIENLTLENFPNPLLLYGEEGCGKSLVAHTIANKFNLDFKDISESLVLETLDDAYINPIPAVYYINTEIFLAGNKVDRATNVILKFLEEPPKNAYIILTCTNPSKLKNTITNRCQSWGFVPYSREELQKFSEDTFLLEIAHTPGQMITLTEQPVQEMVAYANSILDKIHLATPSNTFKIENKLSFKSPVEKGTYDISVFMKIFIYCASKRCVENFSEKSARIYKLIQKLNEDISVPYVSKDYVFSRYLMKLWKCSHES